MLQPDSMNSAASQSSSSGCVGGAPLRPKSKTLGTIGLPKCLAQMWLTATRAGNGLRQSVNQVASAVRRPVLVRGNGFVRFASVSVGDSTVFHAPRNGV